MATALGLAATATSASATQATATDTVRLVQFPSQQAIARVDAKGAVSVLSENGAYVPVAYRITPGSKTGSPTFDADLRRTLPARLPKVALTPVIPTETAGEYAFNWVLEGQPMRYGTCAPIVWTIDTGAIAESGVSIASELDRWNGIFTEVSAVTGYHFAYEATEPGLGLAIKSGDWHHAIGPETVHPDIDILIAYRQPAGRTGYRELEPNLGLSGPAQVSHRGGSWHLDTSIVMLNAPAMKDVDPVTRIGAMRHELGHALGLGHVDVMSQVMGASGNRQHPTWQGGDVAGLRALAELPCPVQP